MSETGSLLKRADRYLLTAELLLKEGDYESAVSRVYYAMFFSAQAVLLKKGLSYSSHKGTIAAFGEHFIKTGVFIKELGKSLNKAFDKRQISDYNYTFIISYDEAKSLLDEGRVFFTSIKEYLKIT